MTQKIIAVVGIPGVGKTTFLNKLATEITFQHLTAGSLIAEGKTLAAQNRDALRFSNIDENQQFLITGFHHAKDKDVPLIVVDGHVVIDTGEELKKIGSNIFCALEINAMICLTADPERILQHRLVDTKRNRPILSVQEIEEHQAISVLTTQEVCDALNIPYINMTTDDIDKAKQFFPEA